MMASPRGIITPRSDAFLVTGVRFHNFDWRDAAALGSCSHCFHDQATDSGARTIYFSNITLKSTVQRVCNYQLPWKAIFHDIDGTLTGKGPGSWATPYKASHSWSNCEYSAYFGG